MEMTTLSPEEYQRSLKELSDKFMNELVRSYASETYGEHRHYYFPATFAFGVIGIITNSLNLVVLTRKKMINPLNVFLSALAIADLAIIATQLPSCIHHFARFKEVFSFAWVITEIVLIVLEIMLQLFRNWLVVTIAVWGFVSLQWYLRTPELCSMSRAKKALIFLVVVAIVLVSPMGALLTWNEEELLDRKFYTKQYSNFAIQNNGVMLDVFWGGLVLVSLIPCILLLVFVIMIIVKYARHNRGAPPDSLHRAPERRKVVKVTAMLLVILVLFTLSNLPDAALQLGAIIVGINNEHFDKVKNATDSFRMVSLFDSSVTFFIYYLMSKKFRKTFKRIFCCCCGINREDDSVASDQSLSLEGDSLKMNTLTTQPKSLMA